MNSKTIRAVLFFVQNWQCMHMHSPDSNSKVWEKGDFKDSCRSHLKKKKKKENKCNTVPDKMLYIRGFLLKH